MINKDTPEVSDHAWQKLKAAKSRDVTQLLCTQNMAEVTLLGDCVAIIHLGKILVIDTPQRYEKKELRK